MTDAITTYLADPLPSKMLLIAAPAGIGKTTIGVRTAEQTAAESAGAVRRPAPRVLRRRAGAGHPPGLVDCFRQPRHGGEGETGFGATRRWPDQISTWMIAAMRPRPLQ